MCLRRQTNVMQNSTLKFIGFWILLGLFPSLASFSQERLQMGDRLDITQLDLRQFGDNAPIDIEQFSGKILYLEWFYWW